MARSKREVRGNQPVQGHFMTIQDACSVLGVSIATIYRYMAKGALPYLKVGRTRVVAEDDILECKDNRVFASVGHLERARMQRRAAAHARHALYDGRHTTRPARDAFFRRFEEAVDPDMTLSLEERRRRAEQAKRAYFTDLARRSSKARGKRKRPRAHTF